MAWNLPSLPSAGTVATVANWATKVIDSLRYLKGMDGVPTIESGLVIDNTDGDEYLKLPLLSTAECTSVLDAEGEFAFDEQTHRLKLYDGTAVRSVATTVDAPAAHKDTHDPENGSDPLDAATPVTVGSANAEGSSHSFARADHVHAREHAKYTDANARAACVEDTAYGAGWNGDTTHAPSQNAVYDKIETLGAATMEFFEEFNYGASGATEGIVGQFHAWRLAAANQEIKISIKVPHDYTSLTHCKILAFKDKAGGTNSTVDWTANTDACANTEAYLTHQDSATADGLSTDRANGNPELLEIDISAAFSLISADDYVGIRFLLNAVANGGYLDVIGIVFKYA